MIMDYIKNQEEAIAIVKQMIADGQISQEVAEKYFPELKESEGDEMIRKALVEHFKWNSQQILNEFANKEVLAWLEKQGEKKESYDTCNSSMMDNKKSPYGEKRDFGYFEEMSADKVEPKFKLGDWVVHEMSDGRKVIRQIINMTNKSYVLDGEDFNTFYFDDLENNYHLWTIADANDGDVLYSLDSCRPFIYKERKQFEQATAYCGINEYGKFFVRNTKDCIIVLDKYVPATKEQRDLLFAKMKEAGYEWDVEKKELKPNNHVQWSDEEELHIKELESLVKKVWAIAERENDKDTIREMSDLSFFLKTLNLEKKGEQRPNPYSGTSFEYNGHTWGMCARDGGVEILVDGHVKGRVFADDNNAKEMFIKALERVEEENAKGYKLTDCDKNSWWEDFKSYVSCTFEQKSADKIEPKFKQGEWIIFNGLILYVDEVVQGYYRTISIGGIPNSYDWDIDNAARLWTIQEAKAGDVLAAKSGNRIFLYNGDCDLRHRPCAYCGTYKGFSEILFSKCAIGNYFTDEDVYPATKKQRDLLFVKMKEAGYEWDAETKELNKIEPFDKYEGLTDFERTLADVCIGWIGEENGWKQYIRDNADILLGIAVKMFNSVQDAPFEQKPTWSEEDEKIRKALIRFHKSTIEVDGIKGDDIVAWLEKQGEKDKLIKELGEYKVKYTQEVLKKTYK